MQTLREVTDFTGVAGTAGVPAQSSPRPVSLRAAGDMVAAVVPTELRISLRALAGALPGLPAISLTARITDHGDDAGTGQPVIEVNPPSGAVVETVVSFFTGGVIVPIAFQELQDGFTITGTRFSSQAFGPGLYEAAVRRAGVTGTGLTVLEQRLPFRVRPAPTPPPPPPPPPPVFVGPTCGVELATPGFGGVTNVRVFGSGFAAGHALVVLEDGGVAASTVTDGFGSYSVTLGVLEANVPVQHRFKAVDQGTGATSNEAGITL